MMFVKSFNEINKKDVAVAGGKGASLGEMTQTKIPVPDGFVILSNSFNKFIEETDLNVEIDAILDEVNLKKVHTIENASEKIKAMILSKEMLGEIKTEILESYKKLNCNFVAIRSSATSEDSASAAWAGQLDTFLNTTEEMLLENIKKCWASLFTPRAIYYRFEKKLNKDKISVAVVVQKMVNSEESGIAFSVHPVTEDENQIIIEAGFGLGEAIVSGSITPDSYVVDKQGFSILDINVNEQTKALYKKAKGGNEWKDLGKKGKKQVLTEKEIIELSKLIVKIENHYNFPCDIEWAKEKGKFYITQSRPITTLSKGVSLDTENYDKIIKIIGKTELEKYETFTTMNVINWEFACKSGATNPLFKKYKIKFPLYVILQSKKFHIWRDEKNAPRIKDLKIAKDILLETQKFLQRGERQLKLLKEINLKADKDYLNLLENAKEISLDLNYVYAFFNEEFIAIEEPKLKKELAKIRIELTNFQDKLNENYSKILDYITKKYKMKKSELLWADYETLSKILKENKHIIPKKNIALIIGDNFSFEIKESRVEELKDYLEENDPQNKMILYTKEKNSFKGLPCNKGVVEGKVIKINEEEYGNYKKLEKLKDYILVIPMTCPDIVPYLKNAKGLITDEGGITCHASIISRELNIPCVVGTKIASKVLNDGDLVKLNADKGIIQILK